MALVNTINFLPKVFQTVTNQRFLGATMDQLAADAINQPVNGYVGRTFAPTYKAGDNYVPESDALRKNYQLEPSVVVTDDSNAVKFNTGYIDLLKSIEVNGGKIENQQRLFSSESYSYDGHFDYDKFVNYYDYYWLPNGPAAVPIYTNRAPYQANFEVDRNTSVSGYTFTEVGYQPNTQLTLVRGGVYVFDVNQPGHQFWIQSQPGTTGIDPTITTQSTRNVFGVTNNGAESGKIVFQVPSRNAQDFFILMPIRDSVDAAVTFKYTDIQNRLLSDFITEFPDGLDGINNQLQNKTLVFINNDKNSANWTTPAVAPQYAALDRANIRPGDVITDADRPSSWKITLVPIDDLGTDYLIQIAPQTKITSREKVFVSSGKTYASNQYWLNDNLNYLLVPQITANLDKLYYQDSTDPKFFGEIKIIDNIGDVINVEQEIIGKVGYTSHNGVVFTNGLKISFDNLVQPIAYANKEYYVEGVGTSINLVPVIETVVPESYWADLDDHADYITINRGSQDRNSWSRSNRWFHKSVIASTAKYLKTFEDYGPNLPGRRPIIEFEPNLQLFNYGRKAKKNVDIIAFTPTDAFGVSIAGTRVEGQTSAIVDGVTLDSSTVGYRVVFANDYDINVRNKIWRVTIIEDLTAPGDRYIHLVPADDEAEVFNGENILVLKGNTNTGKTFRFDGTNWVLCQAKTTVNQPPLFDLVDYNGYSFADPVLYPSSTFDGNKIFSYDVGTGNNDTVLGFPLRYQNFNNIGDILFRNNYELETHEYVSNTETGATSTIECKSGYLVKNQGLNSQTKVNSWVKNVEPTGQYQLFTKFFDGRVLNVNGVDQAFVQIDVLPVTSATVPHLKVYKNNVLLVNKTDYELTTYGAYNVVLLKNLPDVGDKIDVAIFSDKISSLAFYEVPKNLDQNPLNEDFATIALGQIRTHYNRLIENTSPSNRPLQDSYLKRQGGTLSQHSSPLIYAMTFMNDSTVNFINGLELAKKEYNRFKNKFISLCSSLNNLDYNDPINGVDIILQNISSVKNSSFPWYHSDMVPHGGNYTTITYTVLNARQTSYEIRSIFDSTKLSNRAVLVWHNGTQLTLGKDYTFSREVPSIIFTKQLTVGDTILIRDYFDTDGNYIPETPSKLGLYPKSEPTIYQDNTYQNPVNVIRGHDGSLTPAFGDFRDQYLLELEKRIYNNIKADHSKNIINLYDILPGRFRTTEYTKDEFNQVLTKNFLQWAGTNNVDYTTNRWHDANDPWTWNYEKFTDVIDDKLLQGSWRAIYNYWYDTDQPNLAPWQMLGFVFKPSWWEDRYGAGPYTRGNNTLWEDLEAGYIWNNGSAYIDSRFARPGLTRFIPVDSAGNLLPPTEIGLVKQYNLTSTGNNYSVGQQGPAETAWRRSSDYPFAVQMTLALLKPATYFGTQYDTSRFYVNEVSGQFTTIDNRTITPSRLKVNGEVILNTVTRTSGYINWIADSIKNLGIDPVEKINSYLKNLTVKLNYKVGGFTDKNIITALAEQTSPGSTRASVIIPDTNYTVYLSKSVPIATATYSAVIVQKTERGYSVTGYDTTNPFFTIRPSVANSRSKLVTVDDASVKLYQDAMMQDRLIPYGTTYDTIQQLSDFLIGYQRHLESQGFQFQEFDSDLQEVRNFETSVKEFLFWSQQGWEVGTIIVLNPVANRITLRTTGVVVDEITNTSTGGRILDQNFLPIKSTNFNILRAENYSAGNTFRLTTLSGSGICFARLNLVQFESTLIFDNQSDFGDIIYVPSQGVRQYRLKLVGSKTGIWTGALSTTGYIYSDAEVKDWQAGVDYQTGDIVTFNNNYYTALYAIPAGSKFEVTDWAQIEKSNIKTGLLPSLARQAQQFENIYDIDQPPSDENLQLFSAGLIGFRPRGYLTDLGISVTNQTKFYQGYIKEKGSMNSISALTKANFNNVKGQIETFEEWAFKVGQYGDLDGNQYKEFVLDQSIFTTNPVVFTSTTAFNAGNIIVNLNGNTVSASSNVYNSSDLTTTNTKLYSDRDKTFYAQDLPTAGYVNVNDIDLEIFDIGTYNSVPDVAVGEKIWTAKDLTKNWNVYRVNSTGLTATTLTYVLDNYAHLTFNSTHSFAVNDLVVLKDFNVVYFDNAVLENFNATYDNLYRVIDVVDSTTITIEIKNNLDKLIATSPVTSTGSVYKLGSVRVPTYSQISSAAPMGGWANGDYVWIDTDTQPGGTGWAVYQYNGSTWSRIRQQQPKVDIDSINRTFIYNKTNNNIIAALDYVDPIKGKVLNSVGDDIDYRLDKDPAVYNAGTGQIHTDYHWGPDQVGRIWWNLDSIRYIDYEQDALIYRLNQWGRTFAGSSVDVYEWVESTVLPSEYRANGNSGIPLYADDSSYSTYGYVDQSGTVRVKYYFWVSNRDIINVKAGKRNSIIAIASGIENPQNQDVPYATVLRNDTLALYNVKNLLVGQNSVLHLGSQSKTASVIHSEYAIVQEKSATSQIPEILTNKLIDSLAGLDRIGQIVPDPNLLVSQRYGVEIRPRQSMFVHRTNTAPDAGSTTINKNPGALENYLALVNKKLLAYPVVQRKILTTLNSEEPIPNVRSGQYNIEVSDINELNYINTDTISSGYRVLVRNDVTNLGKWVIYQWSGSAWVIPTAGTRPLINGAFGDWLQSYKTSLYWSYADWYDQTFDPTTTVDITVDTNLDFGKLTLKPDTYIKVLNAGNDKFAIYYINDSLERITVGLESGTVQITDKLIPGLELRQILISMQTEVFVDDLAKDFNEIFFAMVKYALTEQKNIDWAFKTSFISANQYIRKLEQFPRYIVDNQDFYQNYINEVKPYRTILREFNINYQRDDSYGADITDFDLPPYWDSALQVYRSPSGEQVYDTTLLNNSVYSDWKNNYSYQVVGVTVANGGSGFIAPPQIVFNGGGGTGANAIAQIDSNGSLSNVTIVNSGTGYTSAPTVTINGTGSGAIAVAVLRNVFDTNNAGHNVIRSIRTNLKFDRLTYDWKRYTPASDDFANSYLATSGLTSANAVVMWDEVISGQVLAANTIINLGDDIYQLSQYPHTISANIDFPIANVSLINSKDLPTANDRIVAYRGNIDLSATADGIDYPGVIVDGGTYYTYDTLPVWSANTIFTDGTVFLHQGNVYVVGVYDSSTGSYINGNVYATDFGNVANVTMKKGSQIDSIIQSKFADNLGLDAGNIYIDGGAYVDRFSSHAPEELVPGRMYDSLNLQVFSNSNPNTNDYAFRVFDNMNQEHSFYRISASETTTLARDLLITDQLIFVSNAAVLPAGNRYLGIPGVIFVNGEKITYYRNYAKEIIAPWTANTVFQNDTVTSLNGNIYLISGNVYAENIPWTPNTVFAVGSYAYFSGNTYRINGNANAPTFGDIASNVSFVYPGEESGFASVTSNVKLIGNTVNVLGQIRRAVDGTAPNNLNVIPWTTEKSIPTDSYVSYQGNTYITTGNVYAVDVMWKTNTVFTTNSYFFFGGNVYQATGNVYAVTGTPFANVSANASLIYSGRTDSGFASIGSNISLLYSGTNHVRHLSGARVTDASLQQVLPNVSISNVMIGATTTKTASSNVSLKLRLIGNVTANIGDYITQKFANATVAANLRVLGNVTASGNVPVVKISGQITSLTGNTITVLDVTTGNTISTLANVHSSAPLGAVDTAGNVTIASGTYVTQSNVWTVVYSNVSSATTNVGNINVSTTEQAIFLKSKPGYTP